MFGLKRLAVCRAIAFCMQHGRNLSIGLLIGMELAHPLLDPLAIAVLTVTHSVSDDLMLATRPGLPIDLKPDLAPHAFLIDKTARR